MNSDFILKAFTLDIVELKSSLWLLLCFWTDVEVTEVTGWYILSVHMMSVKGANVVKCLLDDWLKNQHQRSVIGITLSLKIAFTVQHSALNKKDKQILNMKFDKSLKAFYEIDTWF